MSVNGLSTLPRLASVVDPLGVVGCTRTAPHPASAIAQPRSATKTRAGVLAGRGVRDETCLTDSMRCPKVEDHPDCAPIRRPVRTAAEAGRSGGGAPRRGGHRPSRRAGPGGGDTRRAGALPGAAARRHLALTAARRRASPPALRGPRRDRGRRGGDRRGGALSAGGRRCWPARCWSRCRSGSRSRPAAPRPTCWCRFISWSRLDRSRSSSRRCGRARDRRPGHRSQGGPGYRSQGRVGRRSQTRLGHRDSDPTAPAVGPARWLERLLAAYVVLYALAGGVLAVLPDGAAAHGVLLRPVRARVLPAAPNGLDATADQDLPGAGRRAGGAVRAGRASSSTRPRRSS